MHWVASGLILSSFAAPSSITGVAYTFFNGGLALGAIVCIATTLASATGALLLLRIILASPPHRKPRMLSEIGGLAGGPAGLALFLQIANFLLYQPVALLTTAQALQQGRRLAEEYRVPTFNLFYEDLRLDAARRSLNLITILQEERRWAPPLQIVEEVEDSPVVPIPDRREY